MTNRLGLGVAAAIAACVAVPAAAQYTVDTALSDSVLGETRKIGDKPAKTTRMTDKQLAFWRDYCAKWPKGGSCDRYRAEVAERARAAKPKRR